MNNVNVSDHGCSTPASAVKVEANDSTKVWAGKIY
jgi:hypothetical protein